MPRIELTTTVNAPIDRVYEVARDVEAFPSFMEDLQSITVLERSEDGNRTLTAWVGLIREFKMTIKWTQEDRWDSLSHRDDFTMVKGDMNSMSGWWQFSESDAATLFESLVDYEYDVPLIGPLIKALIRKKMEANLNAQMQAIKERSEVA